MAYLDLIKSLILSFALISVVMLPTMIIYGSKDGFRGKIDSSRYFYTIPTIGNLGAFESQCHYQQVEYRDEDHENTLSFECERGQLSELTFSGLIPRNSINRNYCGDPNDMSEIDQCTRESMN